MRVRALALSLIVASSILAHSPRANGTTPPGDELFGHPIFIVGVLAVVATPLILGAVSVGFNTSALALENRTTHAWAVVGFLGGSVTGIFAVGVIGSSAERGRGIDPFGAVLAGVSLLEITLAAFATATPLRARDAPTVTLAAPLDLRGALAPGLALAGVF